MAVPSHTKQGTRSLTTQEAPQQKAETQSSLSQRQTERFYTLPPIMFSFGRSLVLQTCKHIKAEEIFTWIGNCNDKLIIYQSTQLVTKLVTLHSSGPWALCLLLLFFFFFPIHRLNFYESLKTGDQLNNKNVLFAKFQPIALTQCKAPDGNLPGC